MKKAIGILVLIVLVTAIGWKLYANKKVIDEKSKPKNVVLPVPVAATSVTESAVVYRFSTIGTLEPSHIAKLLTPTGGKLDQLSVELGSHKQKGEIIARIDDRLRKLAVERAQQSLDKETADWERQQALYKGGAVTEQAFIAAKNNYLSAKNALDRATKELDDALVRAPFTGVIYEKTAEEGTFVNVGSQLGSLIDVSKLKAKVLISESDVYLLKLGQSVEITAEALPNKSFRGNISFISPTTDATHQYIVELSLDQASSGMLKAGTFVQANFSIPLNKQSLTIPRSSLLGSIKDASVFVVTNAKANRRSIVIERAVGVQLILKSGLKVGEVVVTKGQQNLSENSAVTFIK